MTTWNPRTWFSPRGGTKQQTVPDSPFGAPRDMDSLMNELRMLSQWTEKEIRARATSEDALIQLLANIKSGKVPTPGTARKPPRDMSHEFHAAQVHTTIIAGQEVKTTTPVKGMGPGGRTAGLRAYAARPARGAEADRVRRQPADDDDGQDHAPRTKGTRENAFGGG